MVAELCFHNICSERYWEEAVFYNCCLVIKFQKQCREQKRTWVFIEFNLLILTAEKIKCWRNRNRAGRVVCGGVGFRDRPRLRILLTDSFVQIICLKIGTDKAIVTESRTWFAGWLWEGEGEVSVSWYRWSLWEMDGGDSCRAVWMYLMSENHAFNNG